MQLKLISNVRGLGNVQKQGLELVCLPYPTFPNVLRRVLAVFRRSFYCDYIILNSPPFDIFVLALLKILFPFNRCKLVSLDFILTVPDGVRDKLKTVIKSALLRGVDMFIEYFKNTEGYTRHYRIPPHKFRYIPFKIDNYHLVMGARISDEGYIFCGGKTRRDFATFIDAMRGLDYRAKIVTTADDELLRNGSCLNDQNLPPNVEVIRHDGDRESFIQYIAASRLVVLPLKKKNISASGISVYVKAMALRKCVIISTGPSVDDILTEELAIMVPPEEPKLLREAIRRAFEDQEYRRSFEVNGYKYALSLKDENRLRQSIVETLLAAPC